METTEILKKLDLWTDGIPEKLLLEAVDQREAIIPSLVAALEEVAQNPDHFLEHPERNLYYWAAYLLAHFEEPKALAPLIELLRFDGGKYMPLVDDLFEDGPLLLANTAGENFQPIIDLAHTGNSENQRLAAIDALGLLCSWEVLEAKTAAAEFQKAMANVVEGGSYLGAVIANAIIDLNLREAAPAVQAGYDRKVIDLDVAEWEYFADWLHDEDFPTPPPYVHIRQSIDDIVEFFEEKVQEMSAQGAFDDLPELPEPFGGPPPGTYVAPPKVGRNDPCPCGSGKKYKKCCGA